VYAIDGESTGASVVLTYSLVIALGGLHRV
jgi:hypothetical protein